MIEYIVLVLLPIAGFIGWLLGYNLGAEDYKGHREAIEDGTKW